MEIEFVGAAQTVTGSKHLVKTRHARVLLDCGLVQGRRRQAIEMNRSLGFDPKALDTIVLSHAHIDHSGALPMAVKGGFDGVIYATSATRDLCAAMLMDGAMIQKSDARYINKLVERGESEMDPVEPLFDEDDVLRVLERMVALPYHRRLPIAPGVFLTFLDAGHVLGSAIVCLDIEEGSATRRLVFTGDLGRRNMPILRDPEVPEETDILITESTYGDRLHQPIEEMEDELEAILRRVYERGGKLVIPSFALERAQEIVYSLRTLKSQGRLPPMPVYVDSPLAVKITDVFRLHPECYDRQARELLTARTSPFEFDQLQYVSSREDSKAISAAPGPMVVISASGMCEGGRVLHHLRSTVADARNAIAIVGFQAPHTLGRRIVEGRPKLRIFGVEYDRHAEVILMNGFSAHADQADLLSFVQAVRKRGPLSQVVLVHGEPQAQAVLETKLHEAGLSEVAIPAAGDRLTL